MEDDVFERCWCCLHINKLFMACAAADVALLSSCCRDAHISFFFAKGMVRMMVDSAVPAVIAMQLWNI